MMPRAKKKFVIKTLAAPPAPPRTMELLGLTNDGRLVVWQDEAQVQALSAFPMDGFYIKGGHYVIDWNGNAVTVHLGNYTNGAVSIQFMCGGLNSRPISRAEIEPLLLGRVIPDPQVEASILEGLKRLSAMLDRQKDAPHRQRGRA